MSSKLQALFRMFYPLSSSEQRRWAAMLSLPEPEYASALEAEAHKLGLRQKLLAGAVAWLDEDERPLMLPFRIPDPRDLQAVRQVYDVIAETGAPLAYARVHQLPDGHGTWDIFHMSRLIWLAHCNRVSGPGSECEA